MRQSLASALVCTALASASGIGSDAPPPIFGDWWYIMPEGWRSRGEPWDAERCRPIDSMVYDHSTQYLPVNQPGGGHGGPTYGEGEWMSDYAICLAKQKAEMNAPVSLLIRNRNCPFPYNHQPDHPLSPDAVEVALDALPCLDYLLMDLEVWRPGQEELVRRNVEEIVRLVREHPNPEIANAYIGNYGDYPALKDPGMVWWHQRDRTDYRSTGWNRDAFYHENLNVAMPIAYPYEVASAHANPNAQGSNAAPNNRAAIFWSPLERVSIAARSLPEGHLLIPWVSNYVTTNASPESYNAPPPPEEDLRALMQHMRLRGTHSFMVWTSDASRTQHPTIDYQGFRALALDAWGELDPLFESSAAVEYLNLETSKRSGLNWSGIRVDSDVLIFVSNLDHRRDRRLRLPDIEGLPRTTPVVPAGTHAWFSYSVDPAARDFDGDRDVDTNDFVSFVGRFLSAASSVSNAGGRGAHPEDIDTNGVLDLHDLIAVARAMRDGKYAGRARPAYVSGKRMNNRTGDRTRTAAAPTR